MLTYLDASLAEGPQSFLGRSLNWSSLVFFQKEEKVNGTGVRLGGQLADNNDDGLIGGTGELIVEEIETESFADVRYPTSCD